MDCVGIFAAEHLAVGLVSGSALAGPLQLFPEEPADAGDLIEMPVEDLARQICTQVQVVLAGSHAAAVGLAVPGLIRGGLIEESPNLPQLKGVNIGERIALLLRESAIDVPVVVVNDAAAVAAGLAATREQLHKVVRVWTLGDGIGFGRYPSIEGANEGGHMTVTLDPGERFCGCGGRGHLESIMGHRAMRKRFLDMEPEEVFAAAREGDIRCRDFVRLWHRAFAAATATSIHLDGPGHFYITGPNARFVDQDLFDAYLDQMVTMSPLQSNSFEMVPRNDEIAVIGAAVAARVESGGNKA